LSGLKSETIKPNKMDRIKGCDPKFAAKVSNNNHGKPK
jgi:hypothetical protein